MPDPVEPPASPEPQQQKPDPQAEINRIVTSRRESLEAEKETAIAKEEEKEQQATLQQAATVQESKDEQARGEKREEWRQDKHEKELEDAKRRQQAEEQKKKEAAAKLKHEEEERKKQEYLNTIHKNAYIKKVQKKKELLAKEEAVSLQHTQDAEARNLHTIDTQMKSKLASLEAERKRALGKITADADRQRQMVEQKFLEQKRERGTFPSTGIRPSAHIDATRKRELLSIEEREQRMLHETKMQYDRHVQEITRDMDKKRERIERESTRHKREASQKRQHAEERLKKGGAGTDEA